MFTATPLVASCRASDQTPDHVCVGVSPFNGYFNQQRLDELAAWAAVRFAQFHFYIPDGPSVYTLEAVGYAPGKARHKASSQARYLYNKVVRALEKAGVEDPSTRVLRSESLTGNDAYRYLHEQAEHLFECDRLFAEACLDATEWVLANRLDAPPSDEQRRSAVRYLLCELPFFIDTPAITGTRNSVFAYHQRVPFLERLYRRELSWAPAPNQAFIVLTPAGTTLNVEEAHVF